MNPAVPVTAIAFESEFFFFGMREEILALNDGTFQEKLFLLVPFFLLV